MSKDCSEPNQKAQDNLLSLEQKEASRILTAMYCKRVDQDNAPLQCKKCWIGGVYCGTYRRRKAVTIPQ